MLRKLDVFIVADFIDPDPFDSTSGTPSTQRRIFRKDPAHPQGAYGKNPAPREKDRGFQENRVE